MLQLGANQNKHKNLRILLAEDCPDSRALLSHIFERAGLHVTCAHDGVEAIDLALGAINTNKPFDMVLLDVQMPRLDGHSTARELREKGYSLPIVALTAKSTPADMQQSLAAGCNGHISKFSGPKSLFAALEKHLNNRPVTTELPLLPVVPDLLKQKPSYADFVLDYLDKLPGIMQVMQTAIEVAEYNVVTEITLNLGVLSLYGYTIFASHLCEMQVASEKGEQDKLIALYPKLLRAVKGILAGKEQVAQLARTNSLDS